MSNYKVTYLLGAGASYHSIPVVNTLNRRMKLFMDMFFDIQGAIQLPGMPLKMPNIKNNKFYNKYKDCIVFLQEFRSTFDEAIEHRTIDTYARKLYLKNERQKLNDLKRFLALYFAFEQSGEPKKYIEEKDSIYIDGPSKSDNLKWTLNHISTKLDYRYDVFFASLLNEQMELPENVNIISWNYDHQLELGYQNYSEFPIKECQKRLGVYPRESSYPENEVASGKVIKLNGSAHQYCDDDNDTYLYNGVDGSIYESILESFSDENVHKNKEIALNFAWEKGPNQLTAINLAERILAKTDELVIIGYSFPYFNRDVDIELLKKTANSVKRIKVMVHPNDFDSVKQSIQDILGNIKVVPEIHNDLDQFYIPSKFFGDPFSKQIWASYAL